MSKKKIDPEQTVYIYGLKNTIEDQIKYVGWSSNPKTRLTSHIYEASNPDKSLSPFSEKNKWIRDVLLEDGGISLIILEEIKYKDHEEKERLWIKKFGRENLTNGTDGGDGYPVYKLKYKNDFPGVYQMKMKLWIRMRKDFYEHMDLYTQFNFGSSLESTSGSQLIDIYDENDKGNLYYLETITLEEHIKNFKEMKNPFLSMGDEEILDLYMNISNY